MINDIPYHLFPYLEFTFTPDEDKIKTKFHKAAYKNKDKVSADEILELFKDYTVEGYRDKFKIGDLNPIIEAKVKKSFGDYRKIRLRREGIPHFYQSMRLPLVKAAKKLRTKILELGQKGYSLVINENHAHYIGDLKRSKSEKISSNGSVYLHIKNPNSTHQFYYGKINKDGEPHSKSIAMMVLANPYGSIEQINLGAYKSGHMHGNESLIFKDKDDEIKISSKAIRGIQRGKEILVKKNKLTQTRSRLTSTEGTGNNKTYSYQDSGFTRGIGVDQAAIGFIDGELKSGWVECSESISKGLFEGAQVLKEGMRWDSQTREVTLGKHKGKSLGEINEYPTLTTRGSILKPDGTKEIIDENGLTIFYPKGHIFKSHLRLTKEKTGFNYDERTEHEIVLSNANKAYLIIQDGKLKVKVIFPNKRYLEKEFEIDDQKRYKEIEKIFRNKNNFSKHIQLKNDNGDLIFKGEISTNGEAITGQANNLEYFDHETAASIFYTGKIENGDFEDLEAEIIYPNEKYYGSVRNSERDGIGKLTSPGQIIIGKFREGKAIEGKVQIIKRKEEANQDKTS